MTDRPILFSAPMVRALLVGTKTQTRRVTKVVKPDGDNFIVSNAHGGVIGVAEADVPKWGPDFVNFEAGDRLWVRETWRASSAHNALAPRDIPAGDSVEFAADTERVVTGKNRPGMFMPRWASRLTLDVTEVRVQRLQNCSDEDAMAEGIQPSKVGAGWWSSGDGQADTSPAAAYALLWDSINGDGAWDMNPWVVAVSFSVKHRNIDALQEAA